MAEHSGELNSELVQMAQALRALAPASTAISRDRLMFDAGRAAARRLRWVWPMGTLVGATLSTVLAAAWLTQKPAQSIIVERTRTIEVRVPEPLPAQPPAPQSPPASEIAVTVDAIPTAETMRAFRIWRDVLRWGPDMLPALVPTYTAVSRSTSDADLGGWLDLPPGTLGTLPHFPQDLRR